MNTKQYSTHSITTVPAANEHSKQYRYKRDYEMPKLLTTSIFNCTVSLTTRFDLGTF